MFHTLPAASRRPQMPEEVAAYLRERIMTGQLRQGAHLRMETLAGELGTSVTPVREALLTLRGEGFVILAPRKGFLVAQLTREDLADTYRLRAMLTGELAARSAGKITEEQLAELEALQGRLEFACQHQIDIAVDELSARISETITKIAGSRKLVWFLGIALRYTPQGCSSISGWREACAAGHRKVLVALSDRDPDAARAAAHDQVVHAGELLVRHLGTTGFWA